MSSSPSDRRPDRLYVIALLIVVFCAAMVRIRIGLRQYIEYDGWIHIFVARETSWYNFARDIYGNAHPPLFFLLLKGVSAFGPYRLVYRSISILSGIAAIYLVARISRRTTSSRAVSLLAAAAFGLSLSATVISCEVRSYMLMVMFALLAFNAFLDIAVFSGGTRARILYAVAASCAIMTHYSAVFFLLASMAAPLLIAAVNGDYRRDFAKDVRSRPSHWLIALAPPSAVLAVAWAVHLRRWSEPLNHLPQFYFDPAVESLPTFLQRSALATFNLFSPVQVTPTFPAAILVGLALVAAVVLTASWTRTRHIPHAVSVALFTALVCAFGAAAAARRYPLGGALRHQFLLFPFAILALASVCGLLAGRIPSRRVRAAAALLAAGLVLASVRSGVAAFPIQSEELGSREIALFRRTVPQPETVYADQFSTIFFFIHYQGWDWRFIGYDPDDRRAELYELRTGSATIQFLRARYRWNLAPADSSVYQSLRHTLDFSRSNSIALFLLRQTPEGESSAAIDAAVREGAPVAGLRVDRLRVDGENVYGMFAPLH